MMASEEELFSVMATPRPVPAVVDRTRWPVHVTVAGNFRVDGSSVAAIHALLESCVHRVAAFGVRLGPLDHFGVARDVPVLLAPHPSFDRMHESLAAGLALLPGFAPVEPHQWRDGYRPHATLAAAVQAMDADVLSITTLTLVSLQGANGHRLVTVDLP
jgi:2'-5' RNA ligase